MTPMLRRALRLTWLLGVAAAGLATLVGSGGGAIGFPPCGPPLCTDPLPPVPSARVQPSHATVQVATDLVLQAETSDFSGPLGYRWQRSADRGGTWTDITGATSARLTLPRLNLADDGLRVRVLVSGGNGSATSAATPVLVAAAPGIVFRDGDFQPGDWSAVEVPGPNPLTPAHTETRQASGGNPGAWLALQFTIAAGTGSGHLFLLSPHRYDPAVHGAIRVIDHAEDCRALQSSDTVYVQSYLAFRQGARTYVADTTPPACIGLAWSGAQGRNSLARDEFRIFDGPACSAGEACPDFGAAGAPLQLGLMRFGSGLPGSVIGHGLDNWVATVWRP